jgi:hypothetical protein
MKNLILAILATLSLGVGSAYAQAAPSSAEQQTEMHQRGPSTNNFDANWGNG